MPVNLDELKREELIEGIEALIEWYESKKELGQNVDAYVRYNKAKRALDKWVNDLISPTGSRSDWDES